MTVLRVILGDQLSLDIAALSDCDRAHDIVLMMEVAEETTYVRHHKQKIALILSAMRHFAAELADAGYRVDYVRLNDPANTGSFTGEIARAVARHRPDRIVVTESSEYRVLTMLQGCGFAVEMHEDTRFFCTQSRFARWADGRKTLRMEFFYREMRRETGLLMDGDDPVGGTWNFDAENRKRLPAGKRLPIRQRFAPDAITTEVLALVADRFADHFGDLANFGWAVTRRDALAALGYFIADYLPSFGDYQDAMKSGAPFMYHALLAPALNIGLLKPQEICAAAEAAWRAGRAPLNAVEGFIRQILGWREFVRGVYWYAMPDYAATNALGAGRDLPWLYWSGETEMNCLAQTIADTRTNAYAHHIQRLMITGNFALLAGIAPAQVEAWYLAVYADAFEWVELPNTHGMALFADGGVLASKPYAASGAYIDRMSDYCAGCRYDPKVKLGPGACPFNPLYWHFLIENRATLAANPRMAMPYRTLAAMAPDRVAQITREATAFLDGLAG